MHIEDPLVPFGWFNRPSKDSGFSFVVFHDKAKRTEQGDLLKAYMPLM